MQPTSNTDTAKSGIFRPLPTVGAPGICGVLVLNAHREVVAINEPLQAMFGLLPGTQINETSSHPTERLMEVLSAARAADTGTAERLIAIPRRNGEEVAAFRVCACVCGRGKPDEKSVIVVKTDLNASSFEAALPQIDRLANLGTISASMAHEVKNALVAVKSFIDLLLEKNPDAELAGLVKRELARIESLVTGTLKYAGAARAEQTKVSLHSCIDHALSLVGPQVRTRGISVQRDFGATLDTCRGDEAQLEQAFVNLLMNGLEAVGNGGTLVVGSENVSGEVQSEERPQIRLWFTDSGNGIGPEHLRRLFEPFFTTKPHGTGLGLAITRKIIEETSGSIGVQSEPGRGTTFQILLPVCS